MRLLGRILWVLFAFVIASTVAALVVTVGSLEPDPAEPGSGMVLDGAVGLIVGVSAVWITAVTLIPAGLLIAVAEGLRLRSFVFYALAGAAIACYFGLGRGLTAELRFDHDSEVLAASGIAAGLIYWLLAGRRAGAWRETQAAVRLDAHPEHP
jgi:hypothetical protein